MTAEYSQALLDTISAAPDAFKSACGEDEAMMDAILTELADAAGEEVTEEEAADAA